MLEQKNNSIKNIEDILHSLINGVILTDPDGNITFVNKYILLMLNYDNQNEITGKNIKLIFKDEEVYKTSNMNDLAELINNQNKTFTISKKHQICLNAIVKVNVLKDVTNSNTGFIFSIEDATKIKELEENLLKKDKELKKLQQQKDDFIWQLGHDLKTPLTTINTLLPIVEKRVENPEIKQILNRITENVKNLNQEITKILENAQTKAFGTDNTFETVSIFEIVEITKKQLIEKSNEKLIKIYNEVDENIKGMINKEDIKKVLIHIIENAIKYSNLEGKITIFASDEGKMVTIEVKDDGKGIPKDKIDHIFDEFYKVDESRHDLGSSGLGLSTCKHLIEKNGGQIWASSLGENKGSTFYIMLKKEN